MIARAACDHAAGKLLLGQLGNFVIGATDLEGPRNLQILRLQIDLRGGRELRGENHIRLASDLFQDLCRMKKILRTDSIHCHDHPLCLLVDAAFYHNFFFPDSPSFLLCPTIKNTEGNAPVPQARPMTRIPDTERHA